MKGSKASCMLCSLIYFLNFVILACMMFSTTDLACALHQQSFFSCNHVWEWLGGAMFMMTWRMLVAVIRLTWFVAWDAIETVDNQCLGLRRKASQALNWLDIMPKKFCRSALGIPRRHVVLSDFMLCPVFVGNNNLEIENSRFRDAIQWKQKETK